MLNEIEKPQVWRRARQAHALQDKPITGADVSWLLELEKELGLFGKITFMFPFPNPTAEEFF